MRVAAMMGRVSGQGRVEEEEEVGLIGRCCLGILSSVH